MKFLPSLFKPAFNFRLTPNIVVLKERSLRRELKDLDFSSPLFGEKVLRFAQDDKIAQPAGYAKLSLLRRGFGGKPALPPAASVVGATRWVALPYQGDPPGRPCKRDAGTAWAAVALAVVCVMASYSPPSEAAGKVDEIIDKTQAAFDKTKSMKSDFLQAFQSKGFGKTAEYRGSVYILKPSKMLWRYTEPKGRMLVSDGAELWLYDPEDDVAYHDQIKGFLHEKSPALFLAGEKTLRDIFTIDLVEPAKMDKLDNVVRLKLTPKSPQPGVKGMLLTADGTTYEIMELMMADHLGNRNKITFLNAERGVEIDPSIFKFTPQKGTPVRPMQKLPDGGQ